MEIYRGPADRVPRLDGDHAITLGTFDGVHRGHQAILAEVLRNGRAPGFHGNVVVTFGVHPRQFLTPKRSPRLLTTDEEKLALLAAAGVERVMVLDFDEALATTEYDEFVRETLRGRLGLRHLVLGHDVHFGRERRGNVRRVADLAETEGFDVSQVASVRHGEAPISSTAIRDALAAGDLDLASAMLGHPYPLFGEVIAGARRGRTLGFPTANLKSPLAGKLLPPLGVYVGWARVGREQPWVASVINIGTSPTFEEGTEVRVEAHLLEGSWDLYGRPLEVALGPRLRREKRFDGPTELVAQIQEDVVRARQIEAQVPWEGRPERLDRLGSQ